MTEARTVQLRDDLCSAAEKKFGQTFGDLPALLEFVLRELLRDEASQFDEAEQKFVEQRLRELGYL
jgi:hypothetical protein